MSYSKKIWDISKYLRLIAKPAIIVSLIILTIDILSIVSIFNFLIGGVFSLVIWLAKVGAAASIGVAVARARGRVVNTLVAATLFGFCVGIIDVIGQTIYFYANPLARTHAMSFVEIIFVPINLAILAIIISIITFIISQKD